MLIRILVVGLVFVVVACEGPTTTPAVEKELHAIRAELAQMRQTAKPADTELWQVVPGPERSLFVLDASEPYLFQAKREPSGHLKLHVIPTKNIGSPESKKHAHKWQLAVDSSGKPYVYDAMSGVMFEGVADSSGAIVMKPVSTFTAQVEALLGEPLPKNVSSKTRK